MSVWFVTPAWQRYEVSALCFEQRRWMMDRLARRGIASQSVVVANDDNLDLARSFGFATLERDNQWLGRRFNDGIEFAALQGATWIVPIGSDSWLLPSYIDPLPDPALTRTSTRYALLAGHQLAELNVPHAGPYLIHVDRLPHSRRPSDDLLSSGVDNSTLNGLVDVRWETRDLHPFQYVALRQVGAPQLHSYRSLFERYGKRRYRMGYWERLARLYPPGLVKRARRVLQSY